MDGFHFYFNFDNFYDSASELKEYERPKRTLVPVVKCCFFKVFRCWTKVD